MSSTPWYRRAYIIVIASIISPIIGMILLWMRKESSILVRALWTVPVLIMGVTHLLAAFIVLTLAGYIESSGDMVDGTFFIKRSGTEAHYAAIDDSRSEHVVDAALASEANDLQSTYWTRFWGQTMDGLYDQTPIRTNVQEQPWEVLWKQPIGGGYASFVIAKGVAYTIEQRRDEEVVTAYDILTGAELWAYRWQAEFTEAMGGDGPRATPVWDEDRLYALGATGEFVCLNAETGGLIWNKNILDDNNAQNIMWGMSASPLIVGDVVVTVPGGRNNEMIAAYDKITGEKKWSTQSDEIKYSTPFLTTILGEEHIVYTSQPRVMGLSPKDGSLLWEYKYERGGAIDHKIGQPLVIDEDKIFVSSGYGYGCELFQLKKEGDQIVTEQLWKNRNMKNRFSSPVYDEGYIYGLDETILTCLDMDGKRKWKGGRYGYGQLVLASGHLVILTERGQVALVEASPEAHTEIMNIDVIDGKTWNYPAVSDGYLLVRNHNEMACLKVIE